MKSTIRDSMLEGRMKTKQLQRSGIIQAVADYESLKAYDDNDELFEKTQFVKFVMVKKNAEAAPTRFMRGGKITLNRKRMHAKVEHMQKRVLDGLERIRGRQTKRGATHFEHIEVCIDDILQAPGIVAGALSSAEPSLASKIDELDEYLR